MSSKPHQSDAESPTKDPPAGEAADKVAAAMDETDDAPVGSVGVDADIANTDIANTDDADVDDADVDEIIEGCLESLVQNGGVDDPAQLRRFLPELVGFLKQFVLFELIKLDMAIGAEAGQLKPIEVYLDALSDLVSRDSIPLDLVMEEIQLRKESGEEPSRKEYERRFPQFADKLSGLQQSAEVTSAVTRMKRPPDFEVGIQIDDFFIIQKLGEGAFAHVVLARQVSMHRLVALKVSSGGGDEPRALAQLDHANIVRVFDQRSVRDPDVHLLYMQYHPGGTLAEVVRAVRESKLASRRGSVLLDTVDQSLLKAAQVVPDRSSVRDWIQTAEWPMAVAWMGVQLSHALHEAHKRGVLHRDVKPANVLLTAEGIPKLADFNVSFAGAAGRAGAAASFGGSVGYMSPEHLRAISAKALDDPPIVGEPADVYSLAILLWELWQGQRPFACDGPPKSWSDAVAQQQDSRSQPLVEPDRIGSASERVLEKSLRFALAHDIDERPGNAGEMAGRLRLALHPEVASLFDPGENSLRSWIAKRSPWLVVGLIILIPNIAAGFFNFYYNSNQLKLTPEMLASLGRISWWVNGIAYPAAVVLMICYTQPLVRAIRAVREGLPVTSQDLDDTLDLGHRAAMIGGTCWIIAGTIYPIVFLLMYEEFTSIQAAHFFVSLLICGGVAMNYPMFGLTLVTTFVYYPRLTGVAMQDSRFDQRRHRIVSRSEFYLVIAVIIPMLAAALMISSESESKTFMLTAIVAGVLGMLASFYGGYRVIVRTWDRFAEVLSNQSSVVPGESDAT